MIYCNGDTLVLLISNFQHLRVNGIECYLLENFLMNRLFSARELSSVMEGDRAIVSIMGGSRVEQHLGSLHKSLVSLTA